MDLPSAKCRFSVAALALEHKGLAVSALDHRRVCLVGSYANTLKSAEIALAGMVCTLADGALDMAVLVCFVVHDFCPFRIHISL